MAEGQDWASYQGDHPSAAGLDFVGIKVTEGIGYTNPFWRVQLAIVRAAGAVPLLYHYPHFANAAVSELRHFLAILGPDLQPGDVLMLDYEGYDAANAHIPMATQIAYKAEWLRLIEQLEPTHQNGTYCNTDYLDQDPDGPYGDALWIATAGRAEGDPGIKRPWLFHQYSERGGLDRDYTAMSRAELESWAHEKGDPMPTADEIATAVWQHQETDAETGKPVRFGAVMAWMDRVHADEARATAALAAQLGSLTAIVQQLAKGSGLTADQAVAAGKAGAAEALAELGVDLEHLVPAQTAPVAAVAPVVASVAAGAEVTPSVAEETVQAPVKGA